MPSPETKRSPSRQTSQVRCAVKAPEPEPRRGYRLVEVLRSLPEQGLRSLASRLGLHTDPNKRIDIPTQVARQLILAPELRDPSRLGSQARELLYRIAEAGGVLEIDGVSTSMQPLIARGLVFARGLDGGRVELIMPIAMLLQLAAWGGESPRGVRALLARTTPAVAASVATHYLGRPATPPVAIALEDAWLALRDSRRLARELEELAPAERKLLQAIEELGGEVDTEELLDLEREPMRLRGASGATLSRRGVGFSLERRGFLLLIHPNRHVIPEEVASLVGALRREQREARRLEIRSLVLAEDHAPQRARFAPDPVPLTVALALSCKDAAAELRAGVGTPRSLVTRMASRFGQSTDSVALASSLGRALGLWDASAQSAAVPPGSLTFGELPAALFAAWRAGGVWDEALPDGELFRLPAEARDASPIGALREMVLGALEELGEGRWVPWEAIAGYVRTDSRAAGLARLAERWAQRHGVDVLAPAEVAHRIVFQSLHALGVVDLGDVDDDDDGVFGPTVRLTPRGRWLLGLQPMAPAGKRSEFLEAHALRLGADARVADVLALGSFCEVGSTTDGLELLLSRTSLAHALGDGAEPGKIRALLEGIAAVPDPILRMLHQASTVLGRAELVPSDGFLWVDDPELREMLRSRRQTMDLFVDPSPPGGLLIAQGVGMERLVRRCRGLGVEVFEGSAVRRQSASEPPGSLSSAPPPALALEGEGPAAQGRSRRSAAPKRRMSGTRQRVVTGTEGEAPSSRRSVAALR